MTIPIRLKNDGTDGAVVVCLVQKDNPMNNAHREVVIPGGTTKVHLYSGVAMCVEEMGGDDKPPHHPPHPRYDEPLLEYFKCDHYPPRLKAVANPFRLLAESLVHGSHWAETGTDVFGPELRPGRARTEVLRMLRDAKDLAVHEAGNQAMIADYVKDRDSVPPVEV